jgi:hypothetical protein
MRRRLLVPILAACTCALVGLGTGLLAAAGTYERGYDPERCAIKSTDAKQTILSNSVGRVWVREFFGKADGAHYTRYYACSNRIGKSVLVATAREASFEGDEPHARSFVGVRSEGLTGDEVGFAKTTCSASNDFSTCSSKLRFLSLKDGDESRQGASRHRAVLIAPFLLGNGKVIYGLTHSKQAFGCGSRCQIHVVKNDGVDTVLDGGPRIDLDSMTLAPNRDFFWRNEGMPRVYPAPDTPE